ncbi:hypothetical protein [Paenibacillus lautus]|uniref:hypothetical protein n=1 Tax=Paenibacillus lautus TaxID=1401 RepID=UPI003D9A4EB9
MSYQKAFDAYIAATNTHDFDQVARLLDEGAGEQRTYSFEMPTAHGNKSMSI